MAPRLVWRVDAAGISESEPADVASRCGGGTGYTKGERDYSGWEVRGLNCDLWDLGICRIVDPLDCAMAARVRMCCSL